MIIGVDIVRISRFKKLKKICNKILSPKEVLLYNKANNKDEFVAGRFAAKEAFLKAKHMSILEISLLKKIQVLYKKDCSPVIRFKNKSYNVSIAHDGDYAVAMVSSL